MQTRMTAGFGSLIKVDPRIEISDPDIQDARFMSMDLKIYGFNLRVINVYSPTECDGSDNQKDMFYRSINEVCHKREKHQKVIVVGDFNAKTSIAYKKCNYDGNIIVPDDDFNDNGSRLKSFCRRNSLCIASTFFEHPPEDRYTWYSCDKRTKKINDYVLTESYVQQYVTDCIAKHEFDFDSDHCILITSLCTPMTCKARWMPKTIKQNPPNIRSLKDKTMQELFKNAVSRHVCDNKRILQSPDEIYKRIIESLTTAAQTTLPPVTKNTEQNEIWKDDKHLNYLIKERHKTVRGSDDFKELTKRLKTLVNSLRNEKLRREANQINEHAYRKRTEQLYRSMKSDNTSFRNINRGKQCDPPKMKDCFLKHFNQSSRMDNPIELTEAPEFLNSLQAIPENIMTTTPPDKNELLSTIKSMKSGKTANDIPTAYIKSATESVEFMDEMVNLYKTV